MDDNIMKIDVSLAKRPTSIYNKSKLARTNYKERRLT